MITKCVNCGAENSIDADDECNQCNGGTFYTHTGLIVNGIGGGLSTGDLVEQLGRLWKVQLVKRDTAYLRSLTWWERMRINVKRIFKRKKRDASASTLLH